MVFKRQVLRNKQQKFALGKFSESIIKRYYISFTLSVVILCNLIGRNLPIKEKYSSWTFILHPLGDSYYSIPIPHLSSIAACSPPRPGKLPTFSVLSRQTNDPSKQTYDPFEANGHPYEADGQSFRSR